MPATQNGLDSQIQCLSLQVKNDTPALSRAKESDGSVIESWEDEVGPSSSSSSSSSAGDEAWTQELQHPKDPPSAPPPTPSSPTAHLSHLWDDATARAPSVRGVKTENQERLITTRPEKQTAVAGRMIAGALGVRTPKKTEEQKAYERAVQAKEIKKRNLQSEQQKKAREDAERAKSAVWED